MAEWIGQTIGKVRVEKYLARGGMAEVYLGTHLTLERPVAVKVMHSYIESDPDLLMRFQREAKAVAGLRHPNIVQIYDFDTHEGHPYIVMEYLQGPSLAAYMRDQHEMGAKLSLNEIAHFLKAIAAGMDYAHSQGIIHRDIKPANIILHTKKDTYTPELPLPKDIQPILTDFGLVRVTDSTTKTVTGVVSGTPAYMSPEQAQGNTVDRTSDTYSLGIVLYEMLAGRVPFDGDSTLGVILKHISDPPPPIPGAAPEIQAVVDQALTKNPEFRYQSGRELLEGFYRAIGMHAEAETIHALRLQTPPKLASSSSKQTAPRRNNFLWIGAGIFACLCIGVFLTSAVGISAFAFLPGLNATAGSTATVEAHAHGETPDANSTDPSNPPPPLVFGDFLGVLRFQGNLDQITITASLADLPEGTRYEAWLINDDAESRISLGLLEKNASSQFGLAYLDPEGRNLLDGFNRMEITLETDPDASPNPSDNILYSSAVPNGALTHIRHLLVSFGSTPEQVGLTVGLVDTTSLVQDAGEQLEQAFERGDENAMRESAEAIVNLIVGSQSEDYKDWDEDGNINNPGDGYGLLLNGGQGGYIEGTITHAELAADSGDASADIILHSGHVAVSGKNVEEWAAQLRDVAKRIAQSGGEITEADIRLAASLANQIHDGIDLDGSESVDPVAGEGGAMTAFEHAEYMADMQILAGENQIPPPGSP